MVLRAGEGVVGALVDAQLSSILGAIVDENFLVAQDIFGRPKTIALITDIVRNYGYYET